MKYHSLSICALFTLALLTNQVSTRSADKRDSENVEPSLVPVPVPLMPNLPQGPITGNTVDCVNSKFYKIQRDNQHLGPWLSEVQRTVENLFAVRRKCDTLAKSRQNDCVSMWNRAAGVQFLRLGLSLFEQKNPKGNQLEILNIFVNEFQKCW